ncbi:MAG: methylmalonyl-CoA carboxyltransferase, partial [Anaerolineae bacterium]
MSRKFLQELEVRRAQSRARGRKKDVTVDGLTARERLGLLLDKGTFQEFAPFLARGLENDPSDGGVIAGFGKVEGRRVAVFAQDSSRDQASASEMDTQKVGQVIERARMGGLPVVGLYDSCVPCPEEGAHGLSGLAELLWQQTQTSGLTPQIAVVAGPVSGVLALSVGLADFVVVAGGGRV